MNTKFRLVLDTNVILAGLASNSSASQKIVEALQERRAIPLLSPAVMAEYRGVLTHPAITNRCRELTPRRVELAVLRLAYVGDVYKNIRFKFAFARDPRDAKFIELAVAGNATHVLTFDADLLSLVDSSNEAAKRLRQRMPLLEIARPSAFLETNAGMLELE